MEDFDLLYLLKTPFYIGNSSKALREADDLDIDESDMRNNELKHFFVLRILLDLGDLTKLKAIMQKIYEKHGSMVTLTGSLIQYLKDGKVKDEVQDEIGKALKAPSAYPLTQLTVLAYFTYLTKDYDSLFHLTHNSKNLELLSIKFGGYLQIYRYDLAQETLNYMKEIADDNVLTSLGQIFIGFVAKDTIDKSKEKLIEVADMNEYTLKIYSMLGLTMMREGKYDNAIKVYDKALESLAILSDKTQYEKYVVKGNEDLASFCVNYIKGNNILYNSSAENNEKLHKILKIVSPNNPFWEEQNSAFKLFDEATE